MMLLKVGVGGWMLRLRKLSVDLKIIMCVMFSIEEKSIDGRSSGNSSVMMMCRLVELLIFVVWMNLCWCLVMIMLCIMCV